MWLALGQEKITGLPRMLSPTPKTEQETCQRQPLETACNLSFNKKQSKTKPIRQSITGRPQHNRRAENSQLIICLLNKAGGNYFFLISFLPFLPASKEKPPGGGGESDPPQVSAYLDTAGAASPAACLALISQPSAVTDGIEPQDPSHAVPNEAHLEVKENR